MPRSAFRFSYAKRVRYAEVDAQAVVFNSRYLEYFDIGLTEYWRAVGMYEAAPMVGGPEFHVVRAEVLFRAPMLLDEMIQICVACTRIGRTSMTFAFELHGPAGEEDLRATGEEVQVHVAEARGSPAPVPEAVVAMFAAYEGRSLR